MELREIQINRTLTLREDGKVFKTKTGEEINLAVTKGGFRRIVIKYKTYSLGHLVLDNFKCKYPGKDYVVHHIDGNTLNDNVDNLEWKLLKLTKDERKNKTRLENLRYRLRHQVQLNEYSRRYYHEHIENCKTYYREYKQKHGRNIFRDSIYYKTPERKDYDNIRSTIYHINKRNESKNGIEINTD